MSKHVSLVGSKHYFMLLNFIKGVNMTSIDTTSLSAQAIVSKLDELSKERQDYEKNEYARSNKRLYSLLAQVQTLYLQAKKDKETLKQSVLLIKNKLTKNGSRIQTNTLVITLFVKYLFNSDRQNCMNYARAISAAIQEGKTPDQLAQFIEDCGGIEQCKRKVTKSEETLSKERKIKESLEYVEDALEISKNSPLASFKANESIVESLQDKKCVFLIGNTDSKGNVKVLTVVPGYSEGFYNWSQKKLASYYSEQNELAQNLAKSKSKNKAMSEAVSSVKSKTPTETVGDLLAV